MDRILILMTAVCYDDAHRALASARDHAGCPQRITYGIALKEEPYEEELLNMQSLGNALFVVGEDSACRRIDELWSGEGYTLVANPAMVFSRNWDIALLYLQSSCDEKGHAVLTGILPDPDDPVDAVYAIAAQALTAEGKLTLSKGTPLRYATAALATGFLNPFFVFGRTAFFRETAQLSEPPCLYAFRCGNPLMIMPKPVIRQLWETELPPMQLSKTDPGIERYTAAFGLDLVAGSFSPMARCGIFTADADFPRKVPPTVRLQEKLRSFSVGEGETPLLVTAAVCLPGEARKDAAELAAFGYLAGMENAALLLFASTDEAQRMMLRMPNVLEFRKRYGLPVMPGRGEKLSRWLTLSKLSLLEQAREKSLNHSHYIWIDFDYLRYPVYEDAVLDWRGLCTNRIVLATVSNKPDLGMIIVPETMAVEAAAAFAELCRRRAEQLSKLPSETEIWHQLMHLHPEWFEVFTLNRPRTLLSLAMTGRETEFHTMK